MPKGLLGLPRPFVEQVNKVSYSEAGVSATVQPQGPMGTPRPGVKPTPSNGLEKCINSDAADEYISGLERAFDTTIPKDKARELKKKWCQGERNAFSE